MKNPKKDPKLAKLADKLADLWVEYDHLVAALAQQKEEYLELRREYNELSKFMNDNLQKFVMKEKLEHLLEGCAPSVVSSRR